MASLGSQVEKVRTKNAGPFWLTIDIFCGSDQAYDTIVKALKTDKIARVLKTEPQLLKRFDIDSLNVIKFSLPRPQVQGSIYDRDMHGSGWAALISELNLD